MKLKFWLVNIFTKIFNFTKNIKHIIMIGGKYT